MVISGKETPELLTRQEIFISMILERFMPTTKWRLATGDATTTKSTTKYTRERTSAIMDRASQEKNGSIEIACTAYTTTSSIMSTTEIKGRLSDKRNYPSANKDSI